MLCIVFQWNLVCDKSSFVETSNFIQILGQVTIGTWLCILGDRFGRKNVFFISSVLAVLIGVGNAFVREFWAYLVFRFLLGAVQTVSV